MTEQTESFTCGQAARAVVRVTIEGLAIVAGYSIGIVPGLIATLGILAHEWRRSQPKQGGGAAIFRDTE